MKKVSILGIAMFFVAVFSMPAGALENKFGGYWRTRAYLNRDFTGEDNGDRDISQVDTRTRLYYTAILNDNLKLVTKFEFDSTWGGPDELGDIGADGKKFEIKR